LVLQKELAFVRVEIKEKRKQLNNLHRLTDEDVVTHDHEVKA